MVKVISKRNHIADLVERKFLLTDPWYQLILRMMKPVIHEFYGKRILEVGCGLGGFCISLATKGAKVIGLDISSSAVNKAKNLAKQLEVQSQIDLIIGDAHFLPIKDQTNDVVVCSETLEHVTNYEKAFRELVRVTRKSGHLCLTVPNLLSTLFFEYVVLLLIGQPQYAKDFGCLEKEHIFHPFKLRRLFNRENLKVIEIRSTDFLHLPPTIRKALKIDRRPPTISHNLATHSVSLRLGLFGATIGVVAKKV